MNLLIVFAVIIAAASAQEITTTAQVLQKIYYKCVDSESMISCVKPKVLAYLSDVVNADSVPITQDLKIVRSREFSSEDNHQDYLSYDGVDPKKKELLRSLMLEKLDSYLSSHQLEAKLPEAIVGSNIVPRSLVESVPRSLSVPLSDSSNGQGRGFVKKVMIPFLLGLKFKATALVPLAFALIALKTWKALTLGLLSLVLSGAMMIFKLTKPKVAYEVVHYGHPPVEHAQPHWDANANGPYSGYRNLFWNAGKVVVKVKDNGKAQCVDGQLKSISLAMNKFIVVLTAVVALAAAQPAKIEAWKSSNMDSIVEQTKSDCARNNDDMACMKFKVLNLLDQIFRKDNFKVSDAIEVTRNSQPVEETARSESSFIDTVQNYLVSHDVTFKMPLDAAVKVSARNIENDQLSFDLKFGQGRAVEEARRSKLKKVIIPIMVFVLLKAMTLIPLAIGVLGLKAWNALQLSFFSFVVSVGLAIFQLCKKIAADSHSAPISAHGPWEYQAQYRGFSDQADDQSAAQHLAYAAYAPEA
ncbi:uncharacterized protein LOC123272241 [Cotesia glomerata]|nr:uncharacterized protein LOC123272241 [Cotesia glomerata]